MSSDSTIELTRKLATAEQIIGQLLANENRQNVEHNLVLVKEKIQQLEGFVWSTATLVNSSEWAGRVTGLWNRYLEAKVADTVERTQTRLFTAEMVVWKLFGTNPAPATILKERLSQMEQLIGEIPRESSELIKKWTDKLAELWLKFANLWLDQQPISGDKRSLPAPTGGAGVNGGDHQHARYESTYHNDGNGYGGPEEGGPGGDDEYGRGMKRARGNDDLNSYENDANGYNHGAGGPPGPPLGPGGPNLGPGGPPMGPGGPPMGPGGPPPMGPSGPGPNVGPVGPNGPLRPVEDILREFHYTFNSLPPIMRGSDLEGLKRLLSVMAKAGKYIIMYPTEPAHVLKRDLFAMAFERLPPMKKDEFSHLFGFKYPWNNLARFLSVNCIANAMAVMDGLVTNMNDASYTCCYCLTNDAHKSVHCPYQGYMLCVTCYDFSHISKFCKLKESSGKDGNRDRDNRD